MGHKKVLFPYQLGFGGAATGSMTGTSTITSDATYVKNLDVYTYYLSWTGTPTGVISVQVAPFETGPYYSLTFDPVLAQPAGSASGYEIDIHDMSNSWIRISYTNASGAGVLTAIIEGGDTN